MQGIAYAQDNLDMLEGQTKQDAQDLLNDAKDLLRKLDQEQSVSAKVTLLIESKALLDKGRTFIKSEGVRTLVEKNIQDAQDSLDILDGPSKQEAHNLLAQAKNLYKKMQKVSDIPGTIQVLLQAKNLQQKVNVFTQKYPEVLDEMKTKRYTTHTEYTMRSSKISPVSRPSKASQISSQKIEEYEKFIIEYIARSKREVRDDKELHKAFPGHFTTKIHKERRLEKAEKIYAQAQKETNLSKKLHLLQQVNKELSGGKSIKESLSKVVEKTKRYLPLTMEGETFEPEEVEILTSPYSGAYVATSATTIRPSVKRITEYADARERYQQKKAQQEAERLKKTK